MNWFNRNAAALEAGAACVTAIVALAALIGVKVQLDEGDRLARAATARDAYRGHLALAVANPAFAQPDLCTLDETSVVAYQSFVDHLLYSAELMLETEEGWATVFSEQLAPHAAYLCMADAPRGDTTAVISLLANFKASHCEGVTLCQ